MRILAAAVALVACAGVPAAAPIGPRPLGPKKTTVAREVEAFEAVRLEAPLDVTVRVGSERSVTVIADADLQEDVRTRVVDDTLVVDLAPGHRAGRRLGGTRVDVTVPTLHRFELSGSGDATIDGGAGELALALGGSGELRWRGEATTLKASIAGSGNMQLAGRARQVSIAIDGSGDVRARGLAATDVKVQVAGSGGVEATVAGGTLQAEVSGSGDVSWWGRAKLEQANVAGTGRIVHR